MGRELKRVPLDFDWPLKKVWKGYINPYWEKYCPEKDKNCLNGYTPGRKWLEAIIRLLFVAAEDAAKKEAGLRPGCVWPHPYLREFSTAPHTSGKYSHDAKRWIRAPQLVPPTKELVDLVVGLGARARILGGGFDGAWTVEQKILEAAGLDPETWGVCPVCGGEGIDPEYQELHDGWEPVDPPEGEGYQLWETTSDGSPVSPVFATLDTLCDWCADHTTTFGRFKATAEEWKKMLSPGGMVCHQEGNMVFL